METSRFFWLQVIDNCSGLTGLDQRRQSSIHITEKSEDTFRHSLI